MAKQRSLPGSDAPVQGKCGSLMRYSVEKWGAKRYCLQPPKKGRVRCGLHGGNTPRGADSPHFKDGSRSVVFRAGKLADLHRLALEDPDLDDLRNRIGIAEALLREAADGIGEMPSWTDLAAIATAARTAQANKRPADFVNALNQLWTLIDRGAQEDTARVKMLQCMEVIRRLVESKHRNERAKDAAMSVEQVLAVMRAINQAVLDILTDPKMKQRYIERVIEITGHRTAPQALPVAVGGK